MRRPCENHLWLSDLLVLLDSDQVCKCLHRMSCRCLHAEYRFAGILDELVDNHLIVVLLPILKTGKGAYSDHVAVATHHRNGLEKVLRLVAVHDHSTLSLKLPCSLVHIKHNDIHSKVQSSLLSAQTCTKTRVEEDHQQGLVSAELLICERIFLYIFCCLQCLSKVRKLFYRCEMSHNLLLSKLFPSCHK